jgi:hypothetical protein
MNGSDWAPSFLRYSGVISLLCAVVALVAAGALAADTHAFQPAQFDL